MQPMGFDPTSFESVFRLALAAVLGGVIGFDRETRGKPAGFRTNILICVGAALLMELSIEVARRWVEEYGTVADPERIAAQIVSGIGFLGAGTIIQSRTGVRGLTTAAGLWVVAAIGMAVGGRQYLLAVTTAVGVMITLAVLGKLEAWLEHRSVQERWLRVAYRPGVAEPWREVEKMLREKGARIRALDIERTRDGIRSAFRAEARGDDWERVLQAVIAQEFVTRATLE